jgi:hypothetical protein
MGFVANSQLRKPFFSSQARFFSVKSSEKTKRRRVALFL